MTMLRLTCLAVALVSAPALARADQGRPNATTPPPEKHVNPQADNLLRQTSDYLASMQSFQVNGTSIDEVVTADGQKIQIENESTVWVERPSRVRSEGLSPSGLAFWDDGKTMTLYCKADNTYATAPAPPTIDATIDALREQYHIEPPGADLLYSHPYNALTEQVTGGQLVDKETIDGRPANHLAFQGEDVDLQLWTVDGPQPLPLRYVITTKMTKGQPEYSVELTAWRQGKLADSTFQFRPPAGAKQVQAFPTSCAAPR